MITYTQPAPHGYSLIVIRPSRDIKDEERVKQDVVARLSLKEFTFDGNDTIVDAVAGDGSHLRDYQYAAIIGLDGRIVDLKLKRTFSSESTWLKAIRK